MSKLLFALGALQILGGIFAFLASKSAVHEILGAVAFGLGALAIGLSAVIAKLDEMKPTPVQDVGFTPGKVPVGGWSRQR